MYRTCVGCELHRQPCDEREKVRAQIKGLGVTSIKWRCKNRVPIFNIGDPVWVHTVGSDDAMADDGEAYFDDYPGVAIRAAGTKMLVFIEQGAPGRDYGDEIPFNPRGTGFCKIPLSRLKVRDGEREDICPDCEWPAHKGHQSGYSCAHRMSE
jgi:hypothetical protein